MMTRTERRKRRRDANRQKAFDLLGGVCVSCGATEKLEFDHINNDRVDESHMISRMLEGSWDKLVKELMLCQLLCRYCHRVKTSDDVRPDDFYEVEEPVVVGIRGKLSTYSNKRCRCELCKKACALYSKKYIRKNISRYREYHREYTRKYRELKV